MTACVSPQVGTLADSRQRGASDAGSPASTPPPAATKATTTADESYDEKEEERTDRRVDDRGDDARAKMNTDLGHQPFPDECSYDAYDEIANDPESGASHDLACQPSCDDTYYQYDKETFSRHVHVANSIQDRPDEPCVGLLDQSRMG